MGTCEYGSKQYKSAEEDFKNIETQLATTNKEWENIQKEIEKEN